MRYWRLWLCFVLLAGASFQAISQTAVRGKVTDENGESMIGVSVFLKENPSVGTSTDLDGLYSLPLTPGTPQTVVVSYISYEVIEAIVTAKESEIVNQDFTMVPSSVTLGEVEVVAKQERRNQYYMENIKKKSASTLDYMSGDQMNKIGDNNVSAAIARVTGVATNGNFITVRGLGDRYIQTCVNGSLIPTLDPFTNNIKLDLFPASFVDNIIITKTASPDIQGDWAAAYISLETKDNPDQLTIAFETKVGYNPQTSFKKIINTETSPTDWLGYDNGYRNIDHSKYVELKDAPTAYEQFCALGLEDYYRSIGITESWVGGPEGETYYRLGLVQLGLLGAAFIDDEQAVSIAKAQYDAGEYRNIAFEDVNKDAETALGNFANDWNTFEETAPLSFSQTFSIGNQVTLFNHPLSFLAGFRYGNAVQYDPNSYFNRTITSDVDTMGNPIVIQTYNQDFAKYTSGWTALATMNYKLNSNNSFSLMFMPNLIGSNQIRLGVDTLLSTLYEFAYIQGQFYEERAQYVYQYNSEHYSESSGMRYHFSASYADGESSAPDFKSLQYFSEDGVNYVLDKTISNVRRNWRYLDENIFDSKAFMEFPIKERPGYISKLKFGVSFLDKRREFLTYDYRQLQSGGVTSNFKYGNLNELFTDESFQIQLDSVSGLNRVDRYYRRNADPATHTIGVAQVYSGFGMIDQSITERLRVSGGLRAEYTDLLTDIKSFHDLGYSADDQRRRTRELSFVLTPAEINRWDLLPSVNVIYKLRLDEIFPSNLRLNFSKSIARPSLREYTEVIITDFELNADVFGNADLKFVEIYNYDIRYENYLSTGSYFSVSLFYKDFKNHIELLTSNIGFTWANSEESHVLGIELEGRVKIGPRFEFSSNISLVDSYTKFEDRRLVIIDGYKSWEVVGVEERTMFGQAPFVVNAILNYITPKGFSASLSYNVQGEKLVLTSVNSSPDIFELPKHLLNFKVSQPLGKHFNISLAVRDILNDPLTRAYDFEEGFILDFDQYQYGTDFILGVAYKL